jgi:hypothetical protein
VTLALFLTTTSGLPPELWEPLAPDRAAAAASAGGASITVVLALLAIALLAGFLLGEHLPLRGRAPAPTPTRN